MGPGTALGRSLSGFPKVGQPTPAEIEEGWRSVSRKKMGQTLSCLLSWAGREEALSGSWDGACTGKSPEVTRKAVAGPDEVASDLDRGLGMWATVQTYTCRPLGRSSVPEGAGVQCAHLRSSGID